MENYFILLELPFDLPESDTNKISEAISKKQAQWSRDQSNPVKKAKASEYLAALEDIKKVMLDPTARKQEAAKAKQIKASKAKELEAKLSLYRAKGDELSEKDLKRLRIYADTFLNKAISPSDYQYERNESLSDDELLYYNEIQEILKSINAQMSKHEIDHCKGIVI